MLSAAKDILEKGTEQPASKVCNVSSLSANYLIFLKSILRGGWYSRLFESFETLA